MRRLYAIVVCLVYLCISNPLLAQDAPGTITTLAVTGGGSLAVDVRGNLYVGTRVYLPDGSGKSLLGGNPSLIRDFGDGLFAASYGFVRTTEASGSAQSISLTAGMVVDLKGTVYIASPYDQRVRRVDPDGILWTAAGSGDRIFSTSTTRDSIRGGFSGDGGPATKAQLFNPSDVALDAQGNLYIADSGNGRIRLVNREGFVSTFAGNGANISSTTGDGGPAIFAFLNTPVSVAVDLKGNVYVVELYAHRVRKIATDDQHTITTFAGTGEAGFSGDGGPAAQARLNTPMGIAVDVAGNVYIADRENHRIRKVDSNGIITTFAGTGQTRLGPVGDGGPALEARLEYPRDVTVDTKGYVYISHGDPSVAGSGGIRRVNPIKSFEIPSIRMSSTSLQFEAASVNTPVDQPFTISNAGKETPLLTELVTDKYGPEFKVFPTNVQIPPGGSQTVTVRYTPTSLRNTTSTLRVYHSGVEDKPLTVTLSGSGPIKSADFNGDGKVNFDDFFLFAAAFGQQPTGDNARYDLDGSGKIDFDDFFLFAGRFGKTGGMS